MILYSDLSYSDRQLLVSSWLKDNPKFVKRLLSYREQGIIKMRYGVGCDGKFYTVNQAAHYFTMTSGRVRSIERHALEKIDIVRACAAEPMVVCSQCGFEAAAVDELRQNEGCCRVCRQQNQRDLDRHNTEFDCWEQMSDEQREVAIRLSR